MKYETAFITRAALVTLRIWVTRAAAHFDIYVKLFLGDFFMNQNQFEMIIRRMEQRYGRIHKGEEEVHAMMLFPMESNLLKVHRRYPESNSRRLKEAICLVFHRINGYLTGEQPDVKRYESIENARLRDAILYSFDPFTNEEVKEALSIDCELDLNDKKALEKYFKEPVQCVGRIYESVLTWEKRSGSNGYFEFIESYMGSKIDRDDKMTFSVMVDPAAFL